MEEDTDSKVFKFDLKTAADAQGRIIPKEVPRIPGYDLAAFFRPCKSVSGDYFDFLPVDDKRYGMLIADVSGKGVSAGFIMAQARTYLHSNPAILGVPYLAAVSLNDYMRKIIPPGMFMTMFYFVLHVPTAQIACVNCGHNPLIVYVAAKREVQLVAQGGMPLGLADKAVFQAKLNETKILLAQDDIVMQYTDGVTESSNSSDDEFGIERTAQLVRKYAGQACITMLGSIIRDVYAFVGSEQLSDDCTMLALKKIANVAGPAIPAARVPVDRLISVADASRKSGVPVEAIQMAVRAGTVRSQWLDNVSDSWVVEADVQKLAQAAGAKFIKHRILLVSGNSQFSDVISLELKRSQKFEARFSGPSTDAVRQAAVFQPTIVLLELMGPITPKVVQVLTDLKKTCSGAEFMIYMDNPAFASKAPEVGELLHLLQPSHVFDKSKGSRPVLMLLSSRVTGSP